MGDKDFKNINGGKPKEKKVENSTLHFQNSKPYNQGRLQSTLLLPTMAGTYLQQTLQCSLSPAGERFCFFTDKAQET